MKTKGESKANTDQTFCLHLPFYELSTGGTWWSELQLTKYPSSTPFLLKEPIPNPIQNQNQNHKQYQNRKLSPPMRVHKCVDASECLSITFHGSLFRGHFQSNWMCGNRSHKMVLRSREAKIKTYFNLLVQNMHTICIYILYIHIWKNNRTETVSVVFFLNIFYYSIL